MECQSKCESTVTKIYDVNQLKDKGTFVLKDVTRKYSNLDEELYEIHCNYVKCAEKINSCEEYVNRKIDALTLQRDNLKKELSELKTKTEENDKMLMEIKKMITIQEVIIFSLRQYTRSNFYIIFFFFRRRIQH